MNWMDLYLARLSLPAWPKLDTEGLAQLHRAHVEAIPFGNVDVLLGDVPDLSHEAIVNKLLVQNRPGYCFEINTLLASLLTALGLAPKHHMARVLLDNGKKEERPRSHLLITIERDGETWLFDAGFGGGGLCEPVPLRIGEVFNQGVDRYRLLADEEATGWYLQRDLQGVWSNLYWFDLVLAYRADAQLANYYAATAPGSRFLRDLIVTRMRGEQRVVMKNGRLSQRDATGNKLETFSDPIQFQHLLSLHFGVELTPEQREHLSPFAYPDQQL